MYNAVVPHESDVLMLEEAVAKFGSLIDYCADPQGVKAFSYFGSRPSSWSAAYTRARFSGRPGSAIPNVYCLNFRDTSSYFLARRFDLRDKDLILIRGELGSHRHFGAAFGPGLSAAATGAATIRQ
jgi:polysaccharide biosynthesis/export protein